MGPPRGDAPLGVQVIACLFQDMEGAVHLAHDPVESLGLGCRHLRKTY
jgi:hypothetical protein